MKTLILWRRKRSRMFKQVGTATAEGSACTVRTFWRMAANGEGTLAIVDAPTVGWARRRLAQHFLNTRPDIGAPGVVMQSLDGRALALGARAVLAVAGASEAIRHWDARLARDGRVRVQDTSALGPRSDGVTFNTLDAFGEGFKS
jgi:hypothetical protein